METKLLSFYGAKVSKDGSKLVVTLVSGEDNNKTYYNACIKLDGSQKTRARVEQDGLHALIETPMLKEKANTLEVSDDDIPF